MKDFLKFTLATVTGIILVSVLFFIIMLATFSAMVALGTKATTISDNSVLVLKAGVHIPDRTDPNPFAGFDPVNMTVTPAPGLNDILHNIKKASADKKIKGILIENGLFPSGWATTEEIRDALIEFRKSGKFVIAYTDYMLMQEGYYLSTAADRIYINPGSMIDFKGLSGDVMFFKKALEKAGVEVQVIRQGKFKGAVEPFILDELSDENEKQIKEYIGSIWSHIINNISVSRSLSPHNLNIIADNLTAFVATGALENKLVDGLLYRDALIDTLKILSDLSVKDKINIVSMTKYSRVTETDKMVSARNKISVIYASGTIVTGKGTDANIGGNAYVDLLRKERLDTTVKAIVVRVNSPGGNAIASDMIWRELDLASKEKPVIISMGNYAASGGYYISAPATRIYASPTTITGSIGVFGMVPNASRLMNQKLGITFESVNTNKNSDFPSVFRPMNTLEKEVMQMSVDKVYDDFVGKVATGRKIDEEAVNNIAQGRVWSGALALNIGLVDEIGGLNSAIQGAAGLAGISTYSVRELPSLKDPYTRLMSQLTGEIRLRILKKEMGEAFKYFSDLKEIFNLSGIQARLPFDIVIH